MVHIDLHDDVRRRVARQIGVALASDDTGASAWTSHPSWTSGTTPVTGDGQRFLVNSVTDGSRLEVVTNWRAGGAR